VCNKPAVQQFWDAVPTNKRKNKSTVGCSVRTTKLTATKEQ
jgi:hypothetical protein